MKTNMVFNMVQALREQMNDPCIECLVRSCCSKPCTDHIKHVYETKDYQFAGETAAKQIDEMPYEDALEHILKCETVYFYMRTIED